MSTLERILVVADPEMQQTPALTRAASLAKRTGAALHVYLFAYQGMLARAANLAEPEIIQLARKEYLDERLQWLSRRAAALAAEGLRVECDVVWAPAMHEALLDRILEVRPGLVIKDAQRESLTQRLFVTPTDWKILRFSPAPLMLVHPNSVELPRRILAAVDIEMDAEAAHPLNETVVKAALEMGLYGDAEVHLAHVFPYTPLYTAPTRRLQAIYQDLKQTDAQNFADFARARGVPDERRHLLAGDPPQALARLTKRLKADLLVLGSIYRSRLDRLVLGSTAESVLSMIDCDVLLVKPPEFAAELSKHVDLEAIRRRCRLDNPAVEHASAA